MTHTSPEWPELSNLRQNSCTYVDPNGFLFRYHGNYYRAIYKSIEPFYRRLFEHKVIDDLVQDHYLVATKISDLRISDDSIGMILQHEPIEPITYCVEWCPSMLKDAALALLDLSLVLAEEDCILQDCYPWNVVFRGPQPVMVDFTSIIQAETPLLWPAYEQFQAFFLRPLQLAAQKKANIARALLYNNISGISLSDLARNVSGLYKMIHPAIFFQHQMNSFLVHRPQLRIRLAQLVAKPKQRVDSKIRKRFFRQLIHRIKGFEFQHSGDPWADYYKQIPPQINQETKVKVITECLERLKPKSVLDLGCNTGIFSVLSERTGAKVVSIDSSENCIERLYFVAKKEQRQIIPLVLDVLSPTPAFGFLGRQYQALTERVKSELVLCLALMHHLHISGRQSFQRIAEMMDCFSSKYLLFEYVDMTDDNNSLLEAGRSIDYSLESVIENLARYFPHIEVLSSDRSTRRILVCSKQS
jgi:SAM-dependent methyltransferase